ncbi:MAG: OmpA family protein [Spirochaetes bacterium]|nr:OmpA family protein [Spirochaetota bacterium]MBU1082123.1 OmpA family protein [Spirochaetota bacterium]
MARAQLRALILASALLSRSPALACAQSPLEPFSSPLGRVAVTERSDFSRYDDGRYVGHVYREARLGLEASPSIGGAVEYRGEALVLEETLRDNRAAARRLDAAVPVEFVVEPGGGVRFRVDEGYPILRGLPDAPPRAALLGDRWVGEGVVVVRPRPAYPATRVDVLVEYEYAGETRYADRRAFSIRARYAVRYKGGDRLGDPDMTGSAGSRTADILIDAEDGSTLFVRESVDETFSYRGGSTVRLKGFILHFHRGGAPYDRARIASLLGPSGAGGSGAPGAGPDSSLGSGRAEARIAEVPAAEVPAAEAPATEAQAAVPTPGAFELVTGERGVVLLLYDLRFVADGDELLASEAGRLDAIAAALGRIPDRGFLVEGHSADLGRPAGQYELSERRAKRIVDELTARGIPAARFVYRGRGADEPIAPNDTEANRARNRRVEITVLD